MTRHHFQALNFSKLKWSLLIIFFSTAINAKTISPQAPIEVRPFTVEESGDFSDALSVRVGSGVYQLLKDGASSQRIALPILERDDLSLELERFEVVAPNAKFLIGTASGNITAPRAEVIFYRGKVSGEYNSHAYLSDRKSVV